jgi:acetyl esterase/lipase
MTTMTKQITGNIMKSKSIKVLLLCFFLTITLSAQNNAVKIWNGFAPGTENIKNEERWEEPSIVYSVYQPDLTVFLPEGANANTPAVIVCPGGGFRRLVMEKEGYKVARWLNKFGIACFVLKYRLVPDAALLDAQRAVSFVRSKASEYNVNPAKIGVMGFSAGGHVVGNLSTHFSKSEMKDKIDSVNCRPDFMISVYAYMEPRDTGKSSSMFFEPFYKLVNKNTPPTFLVHAADDQSVPVVHSVNFYSALRKNGVPTELHIFEQGKHGFALEETNGAVAIWTTLCTNWLKEREIIK